ncbi:hypothetical protein [Cognatiyoonia sp. IB215182]|uniref:hypothetical protein n=1 Tax=Cognatiyoonia sp. IB215182 TaxID=3097353 RepID=UPI002A0C010B|nr:hypothetical protein [Cognatiyoonia sp. IB215182]MDX8353983.1 hypothetical protein [Cognatiyoonia sp. IB215182]
MTNAVLRKLFFGIAVAFCATAAVAQGLNTLLTRNVGQHSGSFHPSGASVFNALVAPNIGGVVAQGVARNTGGMSDILLSLPDPASYTGQISVTIGGMTGSLEVTYDELVRAALFIDGGRTSLYTYWDEDDGVLPDGFARDAGFLAAVPEEGMIAVEFRTAEYSRNLYLLDLELESCIVPTEAQSVLEKLNEALAAEANDPEFVFEVSDDSYIVSDLARPFQLTISNGRVSLDGALHRYYWSALPGTVATVFDIELYDPVACDADDLTVLNEMTDLFGTLALLRSARAHDEEAFVAFLTSLSAEALVVANPEPWQDYTASVGELYPELER